MAKKIGKWLLENFNVYWVIGDEFKEVLEKSNQKGLSFVDSFLLHIAFKEKGSILTFDEKMKAAGRGIIFI